MKKIQLLKQIKNQAAKSQKLQIKLKKKLKFMKILNKKIQKVKLSHNLPQQKI